MMQKQDQKLSPMNDGFTEDEVTTTLVELSGDIDLVARKFGSKLEEKDLGDLASFIDLQLTGIKNMEESLVDTINDGDMSGYTITLQGMQDDTLRLMSFAHFMLKEIRFMIGEANGEIQEKNWEEEEHGAFNIEVEVKEEEDVVSEKEPEKEPSEPTTIEELAKAEGLGIVKQDDTISPIVEKRVDRKPDIPVKKPKKKSKTKKKTTSTNSVS